MPLEIVEIEGSRNAFRAAGKLRCPGEIERGRIGELQEQVWTGEHSVTGELIQESAGKIVR